MTYLKTNMGCIKREAETILNVSYESLLEEGVKTLERAKIGEARLDAWYLLSHCFQLDRAQYLMHRAEIRCVDESILKRYRDMTALRAKRIPLQHILGTQEFMGFSFLVNEHVLIPRQDTEILVETVLNDQKNPKISVLDLCTGSGCIAVSLALLGHYSRVEGTDISPNAIETAKKNNSLLHAGVHFYISDLFGAVEGAYDAIVSNPPYIPREVIPTLEPEVRDHEPYQALYGPEEGLYFYKRISREAKSKLLDGGSLYFEIGYDQAQAVSNILEKEGYRGIAVKKDLAGLDRVVMGRI